MISRAVLLHRMRRSPRDLLLRELLGPSASPRDLALCLEVLHEWRAAGAVVLVGQTDRWRLVDESRASGVGTGVPPDERRPVRVRTKAGPTIAETVVELLRAQPLTRTQLLARTGALGMPETSVSTVLTELTQSGDLVRPRPAVYALPGDDRQAPMEGQGRALGQQALVQVLQAGARVLSDVLDAMVTRGYSRGGARQIVQRAFEQGVIERPITGVYELARVPRGTTEAAA